MATREKVHRSINTTDRNIISDIAGNMASVFMRISMAFNTDERRKEVALSDPALRPDMEAALEMTGAEMFEVLFATVITVDVLKEYIRTHAIMDGSAFEEFDGDGPDGRWEMRTFDGKDEAVFVEAQED